MSIKPNGVQYHGISPQLGLTSDCHIPAHEVRKFYISCYAYFWQCGAELYRAYWCNYCICIH